MKKFIVVAALIALRAMPAGATPRAVDNGLMTDVPNIGYSRIETVNFCLGEVGVEKYQDLLTDSDFANFEACLVEMT